MVFKKGNVPWSKDRKFPERTLPKDERIRRLRFREHRLNAKGRSIPFLLTYKEWSTIWERSGHWHERGCYRGQYVMARYNDIGPYAVGNVEIVQVIVNTTAPTKGAKTSQSMMGQKRPTVSKANKKRIWSKTSKAKISAFARTRPKNRRGQFVET